jgi:hypothetical protein
MFQISIFSRLGTCREKHRRRPAVVILNHPARSAGYRAGNAAGLVQKIPDKEGEVEGGNSMSVELLQIDCMEYMKTLQDKAFDLAIVDVPYGIGESGATNHTRGKLAVAKDYKPFAGGDKSAPPPEYFLELARVSTNQIIWGGGADLSTTSHSPNPLRAG